MPGLSEPLGLGFTEWLQSTQELRDALAAYCKSPLPCDLSERHAAMDVAIQNADDAERLLADAESFLTQAEGLEAQSVRAKWPDLTADERRKVAKMGVRDVQRLVDGSAVTARTIRSRIYAMQNANRAR